MNKTGYLAIFIFTTTLFVIMSSISSHPLPADDNKKEKPDKDRDNPASTTASSSSTSTIAPPISLKVIPDDETETKSKDSSSTTNSELSDTELTSSESKQKREQQLPSTSDLESRRQEFIKSLGGTDDSAPVLLSSLQGLGSLATDAVTLLSTNANETFAPLREARLRARQNFPDIGTNLNRFLKNGREYSQRAYRGLAKNLQVKLTNTLRFMLQAVTRLASTVGGLYQVLVSVLDVVTKGLTAGAPVVSRVLSQGSTAAIRGLARTTDLVRTVAQNGALLKPFNQAVSVGRGVAKGVSEDLFDKVEWAQEGLNSKLELAQALAPNWLLRAHENNMAAISSNNDDNAGDGGSYRPPSNNDDSSSSDGGGSSDNGGYSKLHDDDLDSEDQALLSLSSNVEDMMMRGGREADNEKRMMTTLGDETKEKQDGTTDRMDSLKSATTESSLTTTTTSAPEKPDKPKEPNQSLLNDIFGLLEGPSDKTKSSTTAASTTSGSTKEEKPN